jgi:SHS2 domain-containing protein
LMFHWLDELLFGFSTEFFVPVRIRVVEFDAVGFGMTAVAVGDVFDSSKHACGTEIKAITYSAMQILDVDAGAQPPREQADVYVIVDI